jgi:hypothetical protein
VRVIGTGATFERRFQGAPRFMIWTLLGERRAQHLVRTRIGLGFGIRLLQDAAPVFSIQKTALQMNPDQSVTGRALA